MRRLIIFYSALSLMTSLCLAQETKPSPAKPAETTPTVDQILEKYVQAIGGKAAIEKVKSRVIEGDLEIPAANISGKFTTQTKAPNMTALKADLPGFGVVSEGFDGSVAWENNPIQGLREKTGNELADTKLDADFYRDLKLKTLYPKMVLQGKEKVGDKEAYVLVGTPPEGSVEKFYFDAQSGLLIRQDSERESPEGKIPVQVYMDDYRDVEGVKIPHRMRQVTPMFEMTIKVSAVKHNTPVDDAAFKKPTGN
jgi:hypothetical protein